MAGPLEGVRVVELTIAQQGPVAGARLGDMGAEVIKVESPGGDGFRNQMELIKHEAGITGYNYYFEHANRNKQSIVINLKSREGVEAFLKLIDKADVFITNMRIDVPRKLGIGPDALLARNPRLIYAHASGWGREGEAANDRAFDFTGIARAGLMMFAGDRGTPPTNFIPGMGDELGGMVCSWAITAALYSREKTGKGQLVDTSLLGSMTSALGMCLEASCFNPDKEYPRSVSRAENKNAVNGCYLCADGKWIAIAHFDPMDKWWLPICNAMDFPDEIRNNPKFNNIAARGENAVEMMRIFDEAFAQKPRAEWLEIYSKRGLIAAPVQTPLDIVNDEQMLDNEYIIEIDHPVVGRTKTVGFPWKFSGTPAEWKCAYPEMGADTEKILSGLGYTIEEIQALKATGAVE